MKTAFLLVTMMVLALQGFAQERWTVQLNSNVLLAANKEDDSANVVTLKNIKKGSLLVTYVPGQVKNERKRKLMIFDAGDNEIYSKEAFSITIPAATLKK